MKIVAKIFLTIVFIPIFILFLFSVNLRFQFLVPSFWQKGFESHYTYSKLASSISKSLESQTIAEGGRASDVEILTDLVSAENLKDVVSKNISNVLQYANGRSDEIIVYIPVSKIPKALLSKNFTVIKEQMKLTDLLKEFNMTGIPSSQVHLISKAGIFSWIFFGITSILLILLMYLLYRLVDSGKRLVAPGVALVLSGLSASIIAASGTIIRINWDKDLAVSANLGDSIIGIVAPPIIQGIFSAWSIFAVGTIVIGSVLFFVKKPVSVELKKKK